MAALVKQERCSYQVSNGVCILPVSECPDLVAASEDRLGSAEPSVATCSAPQVGEAAKAWPLDPTAGVGEGWPDMKPFTLLTLCVELSTGSKVDAWLMLQIVRLQLQTQEKRKEEQELRCASWSCRWSWSVPLLVTLFF